MKFQQPCLVKIPYDDTHEIYNERGRLPHKPLVALSDQAPSWSDPLLA